MVSQPVRIVYNEVDDAVLDPMSAVLVGKELRLSGYVQASGLFIKRPRSVRAKVRVPLTLVIAPVSRWQFSGLEQGTGMLIAGEFHVTEEGGHVEGVIPGELFVQSPTAPSAWFETTALVMKNEAVEYRPREPAASKAGRPSRRRAT